MLGYEKDPKNGQKDDISQKWRVLHLPYTGQQAELCLKRVRGMLPIEKCRISIAFSTIKFHQLLPKFRPSFENIEKRSALIINNCIYKYECTCGQVYIGETKRRLDIRVDEHGRNTEKSRSPMMTHINDCGGIFDRGRFSVIARGLKGTLSRKKYETMIIKHYKKYKACMNICDTSRSMSVF